MRFSSCIAQVSKVSHTYMVLLCTHAHIPGLGTGRDWSDPAVGIWGKLYEPGEQNTGCVNEPCFDVEEKTLDRWESRNKGVQRPF
jgi:hypothetical protein